MISRSPFLGKGRWSLLFISLLYSVNILRCKIELLNQVFLVFHTSVDILSRPATFLLLIFLSPSLGFFLVNWSSMMYRWLLIIFVIGLSVTLGEFPSRFLKFSFHICISLWLEAFSFVLEFALPFDHCIYCLSRDYLSSTEFLILLIWPWIYSFF